MAKMRCAAPIPVRLTACFSFLPSRRAGCPREDREERRREEGKRGAEAALLVQGKTKSDGAADLIGEPAEIN